MKITVVGSGYVGLVTGTCLADVGNDRTDFGTQRRKVIGRRVEPCLSATTNGHIGPHRRKVLRHAEIDAAAATGHKDRLAL